MRNYKLKNYRKLIGLGVVSIVSVAAIKTGVFAGTKLSKEGSSLVASQPSEVVAEAFDVEFSNTADDNKLTAGVASIIDNFFANSTPNTLSIENIETALNMQPGESEGDTQSLEEETQPQEADAKKQIESILPNITTLGVANVDYYLNVRKTPSLEGSVIGKLPTDAGCDILEESNGWYKIQSGNITGYVSAEFVITGDEAYERALQCLRTVALVKADKLMVRKETNTECEILTTVAEGEEIEVTEVLDGWVKVNIDNIQGYCNGEYVDVYQTLPKGISIEELKSGNGVSSQAVELIEYAKQFLGNPYVWGGTSLTKGTDCSGFTMRIFGHFGYSLSRTSREQANNGTRVSLNEIKPGDLLFYKHGSVIGHVAIYIGNNQIIHASTERTGIIIGNAFYTQPACAVRILK